MGTDKSSTPSWLGTPPSTFDIVTGYFPEISPASAGPKLRPLLVTRVLTNRVTGDFACEVAYGTSSLKIATRQLDDVIVQNINDLDEMGLAQATRFVVDPKQRVILPWKTDHFGCWTGKRTPRIGTLLTTYQKDVAFARGRLSERPDD